MLENAELITLNLENCKALLPVSNAQVTHAPLHSFWRKVFHSIDGGIDHQKSFVPSAQREVWYETFLGNYSSIFLPLVSNAQQAESSLPAGNIPADTSEGDGQVQAALLNGIVVNPAPS